MAEIAPGFTPTKGRKPRTGERKLRVQFAGGYVDERNEYTASQLRWDDTGSDWDVLAVQIVDSGKKSAAWNPKSGGY